MQQTTPKRRDSSVIIVDDDSDRTTDDGDPSHDVIVISPTTPARMPSMEDDFELALRLLAEETPSEHQRHPQSQSSTGRRRRQQQEMDRELAMSLQRDLNHSPSSDGHTSNATSSSGPRIGSPRRHQYRNLGRSSPRRSGRRQQEDELAQLLLDQVMADSPRFGGQPRLFGPHAGSRFPYPAMANFNDAGIPGFMLRHGGLHHPAGEDDSYEALLSLADRVGNVDVGLSAQELARLPRISFDASKPLEMQHCTICMDQFKDRESLMMLACFHPFHPDCITTWLKSKRTCPICRMNAIADEP
jgi:hypothetical protein